MSCSLCSTKARYKCPCSKVSLCPLHLGPHLDDPGTHSYEKLELLTPTESQSISRELLIRITKINNAKQELSTKTSQLIKLLKSIHTSALSQLNTLISTYLTLLSTESFTKSEKSESLNILHTSLHIKPFKTNKIKTIIKENNSNELYEAKKTINYIKNAFFQQHTSGCYCGIVSKDRKILVTGCLEGVVRVWDLLEKKQTFFLSGHSEIVQCLALTENSSFVISGSSDRTVKIWDVQTQSLKATLEGHTDEIQAICLLEAKLLLVSGSYSHEIIVWGLESYEIVRKIETEGPVKSLVVMKDTLLCGTGKKVVFWDVNEQSFDSRVIEFSANIWCLGLTHNENLLISGGCDGYLQVCSMKDTCDVTKLNGHSDGITCISFSENDEFLFSGSLDMKVCVWNLQCFYCLEQQHLGFTNCIRTIWLVDKDIEVLTMDHKFLCYSFKNPELQKKKILKSFNVESEVFASDHKFVVYANKKKALIWDIENNAEVSYLRADNEINFVEISGDSKKVVLGVGENLIYWDLNKSDDKEILSGHRDDVICASLTKDGLGCVSGSEDGSVFLWDLQRFEQVHEFQGHNGSVNSIKYMENESFVVSGGFDKKIIIWDLNSKRLHTSLTLSSSIEEILIHGSKLIFALCLDFILLKTVKTIKLTSKNNLVLQESPMPTSILLDDSLFSEKLKLFYHPATNTQHHR